MNSHSFAKGRPARGRRRRAATCFDKALHPLSKLWILRVLVPLDGMTALFSGFGFTSDALARQLGLDEWIDKPFGEEQAAQVRQRLRQMHLEAEAECEAQASHWQCPQQLTTNLGPLAQLVGLDGLETQLLAFAVSLRAEGHLQAAADLLGDLSLSRLAHALACLLSLPLNGVRAALRDGGTLCRSGLLTVGCGSMQTMSARLQLLSDQMADRLMSGDVEPLTLLRDKVLPSTPAELSLSDFEHLSRQLGLVKPLLEAGLQRRRSGVNVLLHGQPGTGKNQLAKALAASLNAAIYEVSSEDDDGDILSSNERLRSYRAAQAILAQSRALLIFDEVQDVFDGADFGMQRFYRPRSGKAWINRALESNPVPALWLTNAIENMDPAFLRRFDMIIEMPVPPRSQRQRILDQHCDELLSVGLRRELAAHEQLAPAIVTRAAEVVRSIGDALPPEGADGALRLLVDASLRAQGHRGLGVQGAERPEFYDPTLVHVDADLPALARGLVQSGEGRLCLYGPPGSGKTAWAGWLAEELGRTLIVRRASDLLSKWVGGSEKAIAEAFAQASDQRAVLLIDEVDSFLQDRAGAQRSWEVSLVNEMLTQMEAFRGVFIASTNRMDGLDDAALRRFDLKLKFDYLKPQQCWDLLQRQALSLGLTRPDATLAARLASLDRVTPGDFAAAARRHRFQPFADASDLLAAVEGDVALKKDGARRAVGFL